VQTDPATIPGDDCQDLRHDYQGLGYGPVVADPLEHATALVDVAVQYLDQGKVERAGEVLSELRGLLQGMADLAVERGRQVG
jgi:hypothetical protein